MNLDATFDALVTPSMLDGLMARWKCQSPVGGGRVAAPDSTTAAQAILSKAIGRYVEFLTPSDRTLYAALLSAHEPRELRALFFESFDLLVRTRGPAVAVLRIREIHELLRSGRETDAESPAASLAGHR